MAQDQVADMELRLKRLEGLPIPVVMATGETNKDPMFLTSPLVCEVLEIPDDYKILPQTIGLIHAHTLILRKLPEKYIIHNTNIQKIIIKSLAPSDLPTLDCILHNCPRVRTIEIRERARIPGISMLFEEYTGCSFLCANVCDEWLSNYTNVSYIL